jgi:phospholipid/cholesterol/gamma-HCH transport system substrate-binding protein
VIEGSTERAATDNISALIDEAREKIFPILTDAGRAAQSLAVVMGRIERGEGNVGRVLAETRCCVRRKGCSPPPATICSAGRLLSNVESTSLDAGAIVRAARDGKGGVPGPAAAGRSDPRRRAGVTRDPRSASTRAPTIARNVETTSENLPALLLQTQMTAEQLEKLLTKLRGHWLMGSGDGASPESRRLAPTQARP